MKTRLLGAAVLIALAVLFVPMFFSSSPPAAPGDQSVSLDIPQAPDRDLKTQTMSLAPGAASTAAPAPAAAATAGQVTPPAPSASASGLATVNIPSNRPRDVETEAPASQAPASQPLIPAQPPGGTPTPRAPRNPPPAVPATPPSTETATTGVAAHGHYSINLSAYASAASAQTLAQRVRGLGYPVASRPINQAGRQLTLVTAGPFESRAAAETARLRITQAIPGAPARLSGSASDQQGDAPAPMAAAAAKAATPSDAPPASAAPARAGGWAVQVAAMGNQGDANALRDKLRANGFDGYVDTVNAGGKQLWRVRAGPQTQRADALNLRDQIKSKLGISGNVVGAP